MVPGEVMYHIMLSKEDIEGARYAILPGDPGRVPKIAAMLENPRPLKCNREYNSWIGTLEGEKVLVCSTGIGGPSAAICIEELFMIGVTNFIRVGTSGGMQLDVMAGDVVVVQAAVRAEGTSREYMPLEWPATANFDITVALRNAADSLGYPSHTGVVQCKDSFYGQHAPGRMPVHRMLEENWECWKHAGCLASEMESATLFTVCDTLHARAGAVMLVVWNQEREAAGLPQQEEHDTAKAIRVAVEGIRLLLRQDAAKAVSGK
ncbi:MAG: uridine phosphorylase [Oscillospiraceae bacterium]|nr:uridine phosphorylase [Oscillospiraceae bacterium]